MPSMLLDDKPPGASVHAEVDARATDLPPNGGSLTGSWAEMTDDLRQPARRKSAVSQQHIAEITSQLAIMTRSGVDTASALGSLAAQCKRPALAQVLRRVHESVMAGQPLSHALSEHPHVFPASYVATVGAGEASGRMAQVLDQLAEMQRKVIRSRRAIRTMMIYPALLLLASSSVIVALVLFVLPRFSEIFAQYEMTLPPVTSLLIAVADELRGRWFVWGPLLAILVPASLLWRKTKTGREKLDRLWISLPVVRDVYVAQHVAQIFQMLGLMLDSGVPLLESLRLCRQATSNSCYGNLLADLEDAVVNGRNLASTLQDASIVPQSAREMVITAEEAGKLGEVTRLLGNYYYEEAEARMKQLVGFLEPVITVGMGLIVVVIVLAVMLPVFDLSTLSQRKH